MAASLPLTPQAKRKSTYGPGEHQISLLTKAAWHGSAICAVVAYLPCPKCANHSCNFQDRQVSLCGSIAILTFVHLLQRCASERTVLKLL